MDAYTGFAAVYDMFMDNVPYGEWGTYLHGLLEEHGISDGLVLDLGCGTGTMTEFLAACGYDMIGVDNSWEMLQVAMNKRGTPPEAGEDPTARSMAERTDLAGPREDVLYLLQDMREFELYGTVRAVVSICDSINYVTEPEELLQVFRLVNNYLDPRGIFIFDFNTEYKYREVLGERVIAEEREECSFIWDNYYYGEERVNEYELTLFVRDEKLCDATGQEVCRKLKETHYQRAYTLEEMKSLLARSGMEFLAAYDAFTRGEPNAKSERVCVVAREHGKEG